MQEEMFDKLLTKMIDMDSYMKENMFTRTEAQQMEDRLMTYIDRFAKLHETLDVELVAMRSRVERMEDRLVRVEAKLGFAS